jgi:hypothetical protein
MFVAKHGNDSKEDSKEDSITCATIVQPCLIASFTQASGYIHTTCSSAFVSRQVPRTRSVPVTCGQPIRAVTASASRRSPSKPQGEMIPAHIGGYSSTYSLPFT